MKIVIAKLFIFCLVPASVSRVVHVIIAHGILGDGGEYVVHVALFG